MQAVCAAESHGGAAEPTVLEIRFDIRTLWITSAPSGRNYARKPRFRGVFAASGGVKVKPSSVTKPGEEHHPATPTALALLD